MTGRVVVTTTRLVVRHRGDEDPFTPGPWRDLAVEHRVERRTVGSLGVRVEPEEPTVEVRVVLDEPAGQGYATEALTAVVDHALGERGFAGWSPSHGRPTSAPNTCSNASASAPSLPTATTSSTSAAPTPSPEQVTLQPTMWVAASLGQVGGARWAGLSP